jgi:prepilin-type N-terminal cleavage/methylation domain-containing protein
VRTGRRRGFTLVEVAIAAAILALLVGNVIMVLRTSSAAYGAETLRHVVDERVDLTMDRISLAVMSSSADTVMPALTAPLSAPSIEYTTGLGTEDGKPVYGDPERIELVPGEGQIVWSQMPISGDPRSVVWTKWVSPYLEGETLNGEDDNGNDLRDERGLAFVKSGSKVNVFLTVERKDASGATFTRTKKTTVACRN